jgi:hypothetical protein
MRHELSKFDFQMILFSLQAYRYDLRHGVAEHRILGDAKIEVLREIDKVDDLIKLFNDAHTGWLELEE